MAQDVDYDLIVIGAGGTGMSGAIWAAEAGCKVIILDSEDRIGGSAALSDGVFNAADTSPQRKLGLTDSIDDYYDYYMTLNPITMGRVAGMTIGREVHQRAG